MSKPVTKKQLKEDTVALSELMENKQMDAATAFVREHPHVAGHCMCRTHNALKLYLGTPFLNMATEFAALACVQALVEAGASLEARSPDGKTALLIALNKSTGLGDTQAYKAIADHLLAHGARTDAVDDTLESVLYASNGEIDDRYQQLLIEGGAPLDTWHVSGLYESDGKPSIAHLAHQYRHGLSSPARTQLRRNCLVRLIEAGVDLNPPLRNVGDHPLLHVLNASDMPLAELMVHHGANPRSMTPLGRTLMFGVTTEPAVKWLLAQAPELLDQPDRRGQTPLMEHLLALESKSSWLRTNARVVQAMILAGARLDVLDHQGAPLSRTPRQMIREGGNIELQQFLRTWSAAQAAAAVLDDLRVEEGARP